MHAHARLFVARSGQGGRSTTATVPFVVFFPDKCRLTSDSFRLLRTRHSDSLRSERDHLWRPESDTKVCINRYRSVHTYEQNENAQSRDCATRVTQGRIVVLFFSVPLEEGYLASDYLECIITQNIQLDKVCGVERKNAHCKTSPVHFYRINL